MCDWNTFGYIGRHSLTDIKTTLLNINILSNID